MAYSREHRLEDKHIGRIASKMSAKALKMVAITYEMGLEQHELEDIEAAAWDNEEQVKRKILIKWRNRNIAHNKPELANILHDSGIVTNEAIEDVLGTYPYSLITFPEPSNDPRLKQSELGRLAKEIKNEDIENIALNHLDFSSVGVEHIMANNRRDPWSAMFEILVKWSMKSENTRVKLIQLMVDSQKVTPSSVFDILGNFGGIQETMTSSLSRQETGTSPATRKDSTSRAPTNTVRTQARRQPGEEQNQTLSTKPSTDCGQTVSQTDSAEASPSKAQRDQLPSATFSSIKLESLHAQNEPSNADEYDWLGFHLIREKTKDLADRTSPVVVAVLDSGIYETHPNLGQHILVDQSRCFVQGDDYWAVDDLRKDKSNHGTMVAGIIALKGPVNVIIVNLKVLREVGKEADIGAMIDALKYVRDLRIMDVVNRAHRVHIVNMSVGQFSLPEGLDPILRELAGEMVLIASAGNYGARSSNTVLFPAKHPNVICVGACDNKGHTTDLSSRGEEVAFLCPGHEVLSTVTGNDGGILHDVKDGSSFAAPHAAAVAAHVLVAVEAEKGSECRKRLCNSMMMKNVLRRMCEPPQVRGDAGVLQPYNNCFENLALLYHFCEKALQGR